MYYFLSCLFCAFMLSGCSQDDDLIYLDFNDTTEEIQTKNFQKKEDFYYLGFELRGEPQEDVAQYLPLLEYLNKETGLQFKIYPTSKNSSADRDLCEGRVDFSIMGGVSFIKAHEACDAKVLVRTIGDDDLATYTSMFITQKKSKITSIKDLKGTRFAFGGKSSTQGYLIPKQALSEHGIALKDFKEYAFTGSHQKCAEAVLSKKYDVCALQDRLAKKLVDENLAKIIYTSKQYPSSLIAVNNNLPIEVRNTIKEALLSFEPLGKDRKNLYHWENTEMPHGFIQGSFLDYVPLHDLAIDLGLVMGCREDKAQ